jgi:hypothetical protein
VEDVAKGFSHLILVRSVTGEPRRRFEHNLSLHKAASEVRYIVIFNNGSTTEPNGVSELSLTPHRATVLTTKHSPAVAEGLHCYLLSYVYIAPLFPGGPGGAKPLLFTTHTRPVKCARRKP